jgi:CRP-like cAMP-binding protein
LREWRKAISEQSKLETRSKNLILAALPDQEYERLSQHLRKVTLNHGDVLHQPDAPPNSVYFLEEGVASLSVSNSDGVNLELSIVGNETTLGERAIFKHGYFIVQCTMLTDGSGYKMPPKMFREEFYRGDRLHDLIINHLEARITETSQTALCNQTHILEQRLSRWLLTFADRSSSERLAITQDIIANLLGATRPSITLAAQTLRDNGLIDYNRGIITIIDRKGLEKHTCECYKVIKQTVEAYFGLKRRD